MKNIKTDFLIEELAGFSYFTDSIMYVDLKRLEIVELEELLEEIDSLIRIPTIEELYPYGEAMSDFLREENLLVPSQKSAMSYLHDKGLKYEFYEFRNKIAEKRLEEWFFKKEIVIIN